MEIEKRIEKLSDGTYAEIYNKKDNDQYYFHREDGPAYIKYNKDDLILFEAYWINGKLHREDGPAFIGRTENYSIDYVEYHIHGKYLSKEEWYEKYGWKLQLKNTPMGEIFNV